MKDTVVVNIFGGPGVGKSITAAEVFAQLKRKGYTAELTAEYAKDKVWENHEAIFDNQIYLFAKQFHRIFRLIGKADFAICDSPILLSCVYAKGHASDTFFKLVKEEHDRMNTVNFFIERDTSISFEEGGRRHNLEQSQIIDSNIRDMLDSFNVPYESISMSDVPSNIIVRRLLANGD